LTIASVSPNAYLTHKATIAGGGVPRSPAKSDQRKQRSARAERLPDPTKLAEGELRKSGETRRRIMEAAVGCLADYGYAGTNAVTVASRAGLTRPAMLYHFPTRLALIEATIHYVVRQRIESFEAAVAANPPRGGNIARAIEMAWAQNQTPLYRAYCELSSAARTDLDLAAIFAPAMAEYDRARRASALKLFTPEQQEMEGFHLRRDITRFLLDGLAEHGWTAEDAERRTTEILAFLEALTIAPEATPLIEKAQALAKDARRGRTRREN